MEAALDKQNSAAASLPLLKILLQINLKSSELISEALD
jgi:hypothetical protein